MSIKVQSLPLHSPREIERQRRFLAALLEENQRLNLTAIRDPLDAWPLLILDSLAVVPLLERSCVSGSVGPPCAAGDAASGGDSRRYESNESAVEATLRQLCPNRDREGAGTEKHPSENRAPSSSPAPLRSRFGQADQPEVARAGSGIPARLLDLGAGGGVPGIPIAIELPGIRVTLLDATRKKIDATRRIVAALGIENVECIWGRAEEMARAAPLSRAFDAVVARAVAPLAKLVAWAAPFLRAGGVLWAYKSIQAFEPEINAAADAAARSAMRLTQVVRYALPAPHGERVLVGYENIG
ncbi:MAG: 16S rRNA (guanine(527)-N(7))-methyltransferase RsmG [Phycisphaerae bacterium]